VRCNNNERIFEGVPFALAEELLRGGGEMHFVARGTSMLPAVYPGEELILNRARLRDVCVGDVVLFAQQGHWFVQRVRKILPADTQPCLVTQGDALAVHDTPVFAEELLGRITFVVRDGEPRVLSAPDSVSRVLVRAMVRHVPAFLRTCRLWHNFRSCYANLRHATADLAHGKPTGSL